MAKIIIRFSIYSQEEKDILKIKSLIPIEPNLTRIKGEPLLLKNGEDTGRKIKENSLDYNRVIDSTQNIEDAFGIWQKEWYLQYEKLNKIKKEGYNIQLLFETIIYNLEPPILVLKNEHLQILSNCGIDLAFDMYFDDNR